ncbi:dioxygenase [Streptomyces sp. NPDC050548]|uniref:dioxygenase family protein n=1 Tax=Streptomyces sp. NPDC050548 TaxID=3365629 RepID=UPI0037B2F318
MSKGHDHASATSLEDRLFTEQRSIEVVQRSLAGTADPRLRQILESLVAHVHTFVKDVQLTEAEWAAGIDYLKRAGLRSGGVRNEVRLLSDVLGVSMLVAMLNNRAVGPVTDMGLEGPFHSVVSPPREPGENIAVAVKGEPCLVTGTVTGPDGEPVPGASVDVWHADGDGFYDVLRPDLMPRNSMRGVFTTDDDGEFWFRSVVPGGYPIPDDGPVGELLRATGRHRYRPAHMHFEVTAPGFHALITEFFVADTQHIDSDVIFDVTPGLLYEFPTVDDPAGAARIGLANPYRRVHFEIGLRATDPDTPA